MSKIDWIYNDKDHAEVRELFKLVQNGTGFYHFMFNKEDFEYFTHRIVKWKNKKLREEIGKIQEKA